MAEHLTHHNSHVTAAQLIDSHQYRRPQYLVQPEGEPSDQDDIDVINGECGYHAVEEAQGWGEYTHVIEVHGDGGPWHYLATLDRAAAPHDAAERREEQHDARTTATSHRSERVQPGRPSGARV